MSQGLFNVASLALGRVLNRERIVWGLFGDYALSFLGRPGPPFVCIECLVLCRRTEIIQMFNDEMDFRLAQSNPDGYVEFCWSDNVNRIGELKIKVFCAISTVTAPRWPPIPVKFPMKTTSCSIEGFPPGNNRIRILSPIHLFKGRIRDVVVGNRPRDLLDIKFFVTRCGVDIKERAHEVNLTWVGLALRKHGWSRDEFKDVDINIELAEQLTENTNLLNIDASEAKDVIHSLLC